NRLQADIRDDIRRCGRSVLCVGEPGSPPFAYTIGNWDKGLPELLLIGTTHGSPLNELSQEMIKRDCAFEQGELVHLGGKFPVKIITANESARTDYTIQAGQYHGTEDYPVQQVLIPDRSGRFPDEPECQRPYCEIPVLRAM